MTQQRRPPPPPPPSESTAVIDRPTFSDDEDLLADREPTDPQQRAMPPPPVGDATGHFELDDIDAMPSAHVSEFDISDLDGEVAAGGAPTTIMQLPPSMMQHSESGDSAEPSYDEHTADFSPESVELLKWSAGPPAAVPAPALADLEALDPHRREDDGSAATMPALSLDAVRAAAVAAGIDPVGVVPKTLETRGDDSLGSVVESALAAVIAAQSVADGNAVPRAVHDHLARAVELLSAALDRIDQNDM